MYSRRLRFNKSQSTQGLEPVSGRRQAVALGYDPEEIAPRLMASGQGQIAEQIIALARENGIPIQDDPWLVAALASVEVDTLIPPELYQVVAEVLAYVYRIRERQAGARSNPIS